MKSTGRASTLGLDVVLSVIFGFFGGRWLDGRLGTEPVLAMVGLTFGIMAAVRFVYRATQQMKKQTEQDEYGRRRGRDRKERAS